MTFTENVFITLIVRNPNYIDSKIQPSTGGSTMDTGKLINKISIRLKAQIGKKMGKNLGITEVQGRILDFILVDGQRPAAVSERH